MGNLLIPTGTIDDSNVTFLFSSKPNIVVVNGASYREDHGWAWSAPNAILDYPVGTSGDIYGIS